MSSDLTSFHAQKPTCDQIIDIIPGPFVIIDKNYHIMATNQAYLKQYGLTLENDPVGRHCYEISHHSDVPCSQHGECCPLEEVFRSAKPTQVTHIHFDQQGKEEYVQLRAAPILSDEGEVLYMGEYVQTLSAYDCDENMMLGCSAAFMRMISLLQRVAPSQSTVLLLGESGVGKEGTAEYIHRHSSREGAPFVVVDCGTLGENLIESELFGYEKGAFTGASKRKLGLFEAANGGTLFIDEIGDLPLSLQTSLLRALETGTIRRLGGNEYIETDVRIIAATHRDILAMVSAGQFRQDLYYRLSAFPIVIPPLRQRKDDIVVLSEHFLKQSHKGARHLPLSSDIIDKLLDYDFPGNVRELRNIIERAVILACDDALGSEHIVLEGVTEMVKEADPPNIPAPRPLDKLLNRRGRLTEALVLQALQQTQGHRAQAAQLLGVCERTLYRYIHRIRPG